MQMCFTPQLIPENENTLKEVEGGWTCQYLLHTPFLCLMRFPVGVHLSHSWMSSLLPLAGRVDAAVTILMTGTPPWTSPLCSTHYSPTVTGNPGNPELDDSASSANANWDGKFNHVGKIPCSNGRSLLVNVAACWRSTFAPLGNSP